MTILLADPELEARIASKLEVVETQLHDAVAQEDPLANAASTHLLAAGGKRLRPILALVAAECGDSDHPDVTMAAVVSELTHIATLYHDDVMDSAPRRRGAPSAHSLWGNSLAILTGDLLFARAAIIAADLGSEAVRMQATTFERLCLGQIRETEGPREGEDPVEHYLEVLADKTGSLLAASSVLGAMAAGCDEQTRNILAQFGEAAGVAFQLADDVLDIRSPADTSGKTQGTDLREHVPTMPTLLLRARVREEGSREDTELLQAIDSDLASDSALSEVVQLLSTHEVIDETQALAEQWADKAAHSLRELRPVKIREALESVAAAMVARTQ